MIIESNKSLSYHDPWQMSLFSFAIYSRAAEGTGLQGGTFSPPLNLSSISTPHQLLSNALGPGVVVNKLIHRTIRERSISIIDCLSMKNDVYCAGIHKTECTSFDACYNVKLLEINTTSTTFITFNDISGPFCINTFNLFSVKLQVRDIYYYF